MGSYYSSVKSMGGNSVFKRKREQEEHGSGKSDERLAKKKKKASRKKRLLNKKQRMIQNRKISLAKDIMPGAFPLPSPPSKPQTTIILSDSDDNSDYTDCDDHDRDSSSNEDHHKETNNNENQTIYTTTNKISLTERDLLTLQPGKWLNDTIIDFSLEMIQSDYGHKHLISVSSTFFFTKLKLAKEKHLNLYMETKTWVNRQKLQKIRTWFIPVCQNYHWFLIAVVFPIKEKSFIYVMDSLNVDRSSEVKLILEFLEQFHIIETKCPIRKIPEIYQPKIPQQLNMNDCGLHLIRSFKLSLLRRKFILRLLQGEITNQAEIDQFWLENPVITRHDLEYQILKYAMDGAED